MRAYFEIKELFERNRDEENAVKMSAYMRNLFPFYGLATPKRKALSGEYLKKDRKAKSVDWEFLNECYQDEYREFQYLVMDYLTVMQKCLTYEDVPDIYRYIKTKQWWDTIDGFDRIVGNIGLVDPRMDDLMLEWSTDKDFWVRRIAIDHQLHRKEKTNTDLLGKILMNNFGSNEFFINKAIGWSLRDYSKTDPEWVRHFIEEHKDSMNSLSVKEGSKYI